MGARIKKSWLQAAMITVVLYAAAIFPAVAKESVSGSNLRLSYVEGTVTVSGQGGKKLGILSDMRLHSGNVVETGQNSYAGLALDDEKAVKMDALSKGEVRKKGKKLELLLSAGSLLCDIKAPLEKEETLNIRTSTMITGIRGTILYMKVIDGHTTEVYVLEGQVELQWINPDTGEVVPVFVKTGESAVVTSETGTLSGSFTEVEIKGFTKEDIDGYVLMAAAEDENLAGRLTAAGWDTDWMVENAPSRLQEDQEAAAVFLENLVEQANDRRFMIPMYDDSDPDSGSDTPPPRETVYLTLPVTADVVHEHLKRSNVVVELPQGDNIPEDFICDSDIIIPGDGWLDLREGIGFVLEEGYTLSVRGSLFTAGTLFNGGRIYNTGMNPIKIHGNYNGWGTLENKGRIWVGGNVITEAGQFLNSGGMTEVQGDVRLIQSKFDFTSGKMEIGGDFLINGYSELTNISGPGVVVKGSLFLSNVNGRLSGGTIYNGILMEHSILEITGGKVLSGSSEYGIRADDDISDVSLSAGTVYAGYGGAAAVYMSGGTLEISGNVLKLEEETSAFAAGNGTLLLKVNGAVYPYDIGDLGDMLGMIEGKDGWEIPAFSLAKGVKMSLPVVLEDNGEDENSEVQETGSKEDEGNAPDHSGSGDGGDEITKEEQEPPSLASPSNCIEPQ